VWKLQRIERSGGDAIVVQEPERYTLEFLAGGRVAIRADCNRGSGAFTLGESTLSFGAIATTRAACPPESLSDRYLQYLGAATSYRLVEGRLVIGTKTNGENLVFAK